MQIKFSGEMSFFELRQAIVEKLYELELEYAIYHSRGGTLYLNPTDGTGEEVIARTRAGKAVDKLFSNGPYRSAADEYSA